MKCYNSECNNEVDIEESCFCCIECKASYNHTTVERLQDKPARSSRKLEEWITIFQERAKDVKIEPVMNPSTVDAIDFLSTPLGQYAN